MASKASIEETYIFAMVPENLLHVSQRRERRHHRLHPLHHCRLVICTAVAASARGRQLRHPDLLVRPGVVQARDLVNRALRVHAIHMRRHNANLVHAPVARFGEVAEVGADGVRRGGGDPFGRGLDVDEGREGFCGVRGRSERGEACVGKIGFIEEFEDGGWVGTGDHGCSCGNIGRVHADGDLGCIKGAV